MAISELDLALGRVARCLRSSSYLLADDPDDINLREELAAKLLSCDITEIRQPSDHDWAILKIVGPRDIYESLFELGGSFNPPGNSASLSARFLHVAFRTAAPTHRVSQVRIEPSYGRANRTAEQQTELYMYVFGDDPIGQQVQVLDVGPHSAPTRQLIVSPVPVLPISEVQREEKLCFVVMPFAPHFRPVYDNAIMPAVAQAGLTCRRGDDISQPGAVLTQIWQSILRARLVIADLSGANGNVLYELGLAHVLGHEAILLAQNIADVPFDLRHQRTIIYSPQGDGLEALRTSLAAAIHTSLASSHR